MCTLLRKQAFSPFSFSFVNNDLNHNCGKFSRTLCLVGGRRYIAASAGPIDVVILTFRVLLAGMLGLDFECMSTEIVSLRLQKICWEVFRAVPIVPAESRAKSRRRYTPQCPLADNVSPAILSLVDGFVEEIVKQQVLKVWVLTICRRNVLQEH